MAEATESPKLQEKNFETVLAEIGDAYKFDPNVEKEARKLLTTSPTGTYTAQEVLSQALGIVQDNALKEAAKRLEVRTCR